jgi:hypothetical protein
VINHIDDNGGDHDDIDHEDIDGDDDIIDNNDDDDIDGDDDDDRLPKNEAYAAILRSVSDSKAAVD